MTITFYKTIVMKKTLFLAIAAVSMAFASCGNKTNAAADAVDSTEVSSAASQVDSVVNALDAQLQGKDAQGLQATVESVQKTYQELVESGKVEEAKAYASKVKEFLDKHAAEITAVTSGNTTVTDIVNAVKNLPTTAVTTTEEAGAAVKSDVENAAKTVANAAKDSVKSKVNKAVDEASKEASKKASDAVNNAANKALKGLGL